MKEIKEFIIANTNIATIEDLEFMQKIPLDVCIELIGQYHKQKLEKTKQSIEDEFDWLIGEGGYGS